MPNPYDKVTFSGWIITENEKSYLIEVQHQEEEMWFPKSQIIIHPNNSFTIPQWLADKKNLEE